MLANPDKFQAIVIRKIAEWKIPIPKYQQPNY